jgi:hypothetical protein
MITVYTKIFTGSDGSCQIFYVNEPPRILVVDERC